MRDIRRPNALEPIVERLTNVDYTRSNIPVFPTIMDLLIFSAGVGLSNNRKCDVPASGKAIPIRVFENNQKEGYLHLVALASERDPNVFAIKNDDETAKTFEQYAAGGLELIGEWLAMKPDDFSGVETLLAEMQRLVPTEPQDIESPSPL